MNYSLANYVNYEHSLRSDDIKKQLEIEQVKEICKSLNLKDCQDLKSLDIGCATCRYPQFFNSIGFLAIGYDTNDQIVQLYSKKLSDNDRIRILTKNVLKIEPEYSQYNVITCMMGTFNHFNHIEKEAFLKWAYASLKPNGALIFSIWNPNCYYQKLLSFYDRSQIEFIQNNLMSLNEVLKLLGQSEFTTKETSPICMMPNICYEAWEEDVQIYQFKSIDTFLQGHLESWRNAQMFVLTAIRS